MRFIDFADLKGDGEKIMVSSDGLIHQRADSRSKKNYNPAACGKKPHSQKDRQDEKAEGYVADEGTR